LDLLYIRSWAESADEGLGLDNSQVQASSFTRPTKRRHVEDGHAVVEPPLQNQPGFQQGPPVSNEIVNARTTNDRHVEPQLPIPGIQQYETLGVDGELHTKATKGCRLIYYNAAQGAIDMAFLVPSDTFAKLWDLHNGSELHSIIMTMPIEDRVASVMLSLPPADAVQFAYHFNLEIIFNSSAISA